MIGEIRQNFTEASASVGLILATALGGQIYEYVIKRVVVGLIPLKLHPKCFWKKGNLVKIKRNNLK